MTTERRVELTSSAWLFNPERLFYIAGQINKERTASAHIGVELYPVVDRIPPINRIPFFRGLRTVKDHEIALGDGRISLDKICGWEKNYGSVPVQRIHLPFHWDIPTAFYNYFYDSVFKEPGKWSDRMMASFVAWLTKTVSNGFAQNLAGELGAGLNAHVNIVEEAAKRNQLEFMRGRAPFVWVENDLDRPRVRPEQIERARDPKRAIAAVEKYGLEGVILGVDHDFLYQIDPRETLGDNEADLKKHLRSFHIAGSEGFRGLVDEHDGNFWGFVDYVRERGFDDVGFCLDLNPFAMAQLTQGEQVDYVRDLVEKLER